MTHGNEESFLPKELGRLDSSDKHRSEGVKMTAPYYLRSKLPTQFRTSKIMLNGVSLARRKW
ncbi:hypothetical protein EV281_1011158 [Rhizobium sp. BK418]|nr:hypothetical protein EV281_1011158 [Rhizobium sp. BK418]